MPTNALRHADWILGVILGAALLAAGLATVGLRQTASMSTTARMLVLLVALPARRRGQEKRDDPTDHRLGRPS
jgi:hypothetical protein